MAESTDLLGLAEATTREATDQTYLRRGNVDYRVSMLTLTGGMATFDHAHVTASASCAGFMSVAMFKQDERDRHQRYQLRSATPALPTRSAE